MPKEILSIACVGCQHSLKSIIAYFDDCVEKDYDPTLRIKHIEKEGFPRALSVQIEWYNPATANFEWSHLGWIPENEGQLDEAWEWIEENSILQENRISHEYVKTQITDIFYDSKTNKLRYFTLDIYPDGLE
jgi:hypothetical protein